MFGLGSYVCKEPRKIQPFSGGGAGIGRETALQCAKFKYVIASPLLTRKQINLPVRVPRVEPNLYWATSTNPRRIVLPQKLNAQEGRSKIRWLKDSSYLNLIAREAVGLRCDVTSWDDQVNLFQTGFDTFGSVDIVVRWIVNTLKTRNSPSVI